MVERRRPKWLDPHGDGIRIRMRVKGQTYTEIVPGDYYNPRDLAAAEKRAIEVNGRLKLGLSAELASDQRGSTFIDDCQSYLNALGADFSVSVDYERSLNKYWVPAFGRVMTADITTKAIRAIITSMETSGKRKQNVLGPLKGVFDHADIRPNPADIKIKIRASEKPKIQRFKPDERGHLMRELEKTGNYQLIAYFAMLFGCGLRPGGEPLGLKWSDYNGELLHVHRTIVRCRIKNTTKTHHDRHVYVPEWVRPYINRLPSRLAGDWLFLNTIGGPLLDTKILNRLWVKIFDTKSIKHTHRMEYRIPYVCRHTRAAELLSRKVDVAEAASQMGHSVQMFLNTYSEFIKEYSDDKGYSHLEGVSPELSIVCPGRAEQNNKT